MDVITRVLGDEAVVWEDGDSAVTVDERDKPVCEPVGVIPSAAYLKREKEHQSDEHLAAWGTENSRGLRHGT